MENILHVGLDVGSTTVKIVVLDSNLNVIYQNYERHFSDTKNTVCNVLEKLEKSYPNSEFTISLTGSGAMSAANFLNLPFIQEVVSCKKAVEKYIPETDVVIELGGEDAKIIYFDQFIEQRMNGTCAGGTGAFIDQMASLLHTDAGGLNELAKKYSTIYPIASRCGVFAKTDIQPLLNEGAAKEDIAVSIFQAVVNQTISGLACGRPIRGNVAFLGGPLNYLSELRQRFIETLKLKDDEIILPEEAHLFVAKGAAITSIENKPITNEMLKSKINVLKESHDSTTIPLDPLFSIDADYEEFKQRHAKDTVKKGKLEGFEGDCFVGIDAGSTTTKLVLIDNEGKLLYSLYGNNEGNPLKSVMGMLKKLYSVLPEKADIRFSGVTGYGEQLIKTALKIDLNEIETIAHYTAAKEFMPGVTSIVDIGGQDMKYIKIKKGSIDNIMLNEACSSGCGSFIETFAKSLNLSIEEFVGAAIESRKPVDLGSRCTVFMNSKIKQAQKEGYSVGDISAGLSYSVIKNAIQKVMKIRDVNTLGNSIVVQGGTFYNDAVLRAFELIVGKNVIRPDIAGLMGAYGAALLAKQQYESNLDMEYHSSILKSDEIDKLEVTTTHVRCQNCENHCLLTINKFNDGSRYISGNRCEKGAGITNKNTDLPNLIKYKYERLFNYIPLTEDYAKRGTIGIPRVLNMYEDYPFWFTFLTNLGFRVILSEKSNRKTYEKGIESMPSESVCFPAKLSHGHIVSLINNGIKTIFYPCVPYSRKEYEDSDNHYNCPIVISYSEVLKNNVEELKSGDIEFLNPFLPFEPEKLAKTMYELPEFKKYNFTKKELLIAAKMAELEYQNFKKDIRKKGEETLKYLEENNLKGIVIAGRPYHTDPEVNHGIDTLITSLGLSVLTEDSVCHLTKAKRPLRVVDQWTFHARLYAAADLVGKKDFLELVQLNSFGCGVDAVTTDQVEEILSSFGKMYTLIKIDEINNLGAVRIRIRSLLASMNKRIKQKEEDNIGDYGIKKIPFTKQMNEKYTILCPQMAPIHFELIETAARASGYNIELLRECTNHTVETGLKYVNNDACYPSILTTGQFIEALQSGKYDVNKTAIIMSQTGGGCRATNYIGFIRKALKDAGFPQVPVISFNVVGMEKNPGFKITLGFIERLFKAVILGDLIQKLLTKNRAYEIHKGETQELYDLWLEKCKQIVTKSSLKQMKKFIFEMVEEFEKIELDTSVKKPKVGIVGEVLIKYHPFGNNFVANKLEQEGAEVILPDFMGFIKFIATHKITFNQLIKTGALKASVFKYAIKLIDILEKSSVEALSKSRKGYLLPCNIWELEEKVKGILSIGNQTGEGWFLTAEMVEYIEHGISNIVCVQPFACLPNHVVGKGVIKTIRSKYPNANIAPIDYDPGASEANQTNRLKLLMTVAKDNLKRENNKK
ncbi:MAG: 2-hydroxyacyl-CoA dehydratase [Clostridia bacterium]|nr:2-hydroxyacyl-CoA dehydratase [Clostridia bacterium]MBR3199469.1 2-hydroxyacyl-CoA dehydratase [Bacilli bacterium]